MTRVDRFRLDYWLALQFTAEVILTTGHPPYWIGPGAPAVGLDGAIQPEDLVCLVRHGRTPGGHQRHLAQAPHPGLEGVLSLPKALTLARINAGDDRSREVLREIHKIVGEELGKLRVEARAGHAGKTRVEGLPIVGMAPQRANYAGEPLDHVHFFVAPVAYEPGLNKLLSFDRPKCVQDLQHANDRINGRVAEVVRDKLGVRVVLEGRTLTCPDVPAACVAATSTRTQQINDYLKACGVPPSHLAKQIAAHATRSPNGRAGLDPNLDEVTRTICRAHGFDPAAVYGRERPRQAHDAEVCRLVRDAADALAKRHGSFSRREHEALAHREAVNRGVRASDVDRLVERVYGNWAVYGMHKLPGGAYTSNLARAAWEHLKHQAEGIPRVDPAAAWKLAEGGAALLATAGKKGWQAVRATLEKLTPARQLEVVLVKNATRYLARVTPQSSVPRAHTRALLATFTLGLGGLQDRLRYAEHVYRQQRTPKEILTRNTLLVIRDPSRQRVSDLVRLLHLARKRGAKVVFVDRQRPEPGPAQPARQAYREFFGNGQRLEPRGPGHAPRETRRQRP